ncbi:MAG: DNA cytosine methyltransferase [Glaciimonas sp.]|nr:DNA cytosine methyltransferase [Glaciimonas sp.]
MTKKKQKLRFASLFSGCGGLDLGFLQAGFECVAAFDNDRDAIAAYKKNIGLHIHETDLKTAEPNHISELISSADVLVAGPPCQGFSTAGKNDPNDSRNSLLLKVAEIVDFARPAVVIIENVRGLVSPRFKSYWNLLLSTLAESGYNVSYRLVEATEFGLPQTRRRIILAGVLAPVPLSLNFPSVKKNTLRDVLANIKECNQHSTRSLTPTGDAFNIAAHIGPGCKLSNVRGGQLSVHTWDIPNVFGKTTKQERELLERLISLRRKIRRRKTGDADPVSLPDLSESMGYSVIEILERLIVKGYIRKLGEYYDLTHAFNGKFRRLQWKEPAPTVDTRFGQPRYFLHPDENRGFTIREAARIQGFPDDFCFEGSGNAAYRLIGNAVPPPMAKSIAEIVRTHLVGI